MDIFSNVRSFKTTPSLALLSVAFSLLVATGASAALTFDFETKWGSFGSGEGQFNRPVAVAVDSASRVYVAERDINRVQVFDSSGNFLFKLGGLQTPSGPEGVAVGSTDSVYVTSVFTHDVLVFDSSGNFLFKFGSQGSGNGQFENPSGIAVDAAGRIYVGDHSINVSRVQVFDSSGNFLFKFGSKCQILLPEPTCVDPDGSGPLQFGDGQFSNPSNIAVDSAGRIYVSDVNNRRVQVFDSSGNFLFKFGSFGTADGQFRNPRGITVDFNRRIYVADADKFQVQIFDSNGNFLAKFGSQGSGDGQFQGLVGLARDQQSGNLYTTDTSLNRIQKFVPSDSDSDGIPNAVERALTGSSIGLTVTTTGIDTLTATLLPDGSVRFSGTALVGATIVPVSVTLPSGTSVPSPFFISSSVVGGKQVVNVTPATLPAGATKTIVLKKAGSVCVVDGPTDVSANLNTKTCPNDPVNFQSKVPCNGTPKSFGIFPDGLSRTYTCTQHADGTATVEGLRYSTVFQFIVDSDGDGVNDDVDACPNTPSGAKADATGCSAAQLFELIINFINTELAGAPAQNAWRSQVEQARASANRGAKIAALNQLSAFINAVNAQRNKQITNEQADRLINLTNSLKNLLSNPPALAKSKTKFVKKAKKQIVKDRQKGKKLQNAVIGNGN